MRQKQKNRNRNRKLNTMKWEPKFHGVKSFVQGQPPPYLLSVMKQSICKIEKLFPSSEAVCTDLPGDSLLNRAVMEDVGRRRDSEGCRVLASAAHRLKQERYREDYHGPCARMTHKFMKGSVFLFFFFFLENDTALYQETQQFYPLAHTQ